MEWNKNGIQFKDKNWNSFLEGGRKGSTKKAAQLWQHIVHSGNHVTEDLAVSESASGTWIWKES
jgi:hypothetical protein